jgi:2-phosphosulfolactate phosphatase
VRIQVLWTKEALLGAELQGWAAVVIDCLRATSSIAVALASGSLGVVPTRGEEEARRIAAERRAQGARVLLAGEQDAAPVPGFDLGNSPSEFLGAGGKTVVLSTTNGSRAIRAAAAAGARVVTCSLLNVGAVARYVSRFDRICVVCSGTRGRFALDDAFCAGALIARLAPGDGAPSAGGGPADLDDAALAARLLYRSGQGREREFLWGVEAARYLRDRGFGADVDFCAQVDRFPVVPAWNADALVAETV